MIYLVTNKQELFKSDLYEVIDVDKSLELLEDNVILQYDSETTGLDPFINKLLCVQFGSDKKDFQIVVDTSTVDILLYKDILESRILVGHNLKFDLQFLYTKGIIPRKVYDTMIVEQFIYLGYKPGNISMSLQAVANRYLNIYIDKEVRGDIIWKGLDDSTILYAANDVKYLEKILHKQKEIYISRNALIGAKLECDFVPVIAYLEWCGIKLDESKWKDKMAKDSANLEEAVKKLNSFVLSNPNLKEYTFTPIIGDLFEEVDFSPQCKINWSSSKQVIPLAKKLGFNTTVIDKTSGEEKDSVMEKELKGQKGINDEFLELYFDYQGYAKVVTSYGQGHLNSIHPITGRLHTIYRQIGTTSGRMSSGNSKQNNNEIAKLKGLPINPSNKQKQEGLGCPFPNMQQLPSDHETRGSFVSEKGNLFCSCDYAAMEGRIGAEVYNETEFINEFLYGSGDTHSVFAKAAFKEELKDIPIKEIKKLRPDLRQKAKAYGFSIMFGSDGTATAKNLGIPVEQARSDVKEILSNLKGLGNFKITSSKSIRELGYVLVNPITGHRCYWEGWEDWKKDQDSFTPQFWEEYKQYHKGTDSPIAKRVKHHFKEASKKDRDALNQPTQGGGAVVLKDACITWFNWVVDNGYFGKILLVNLTHDEHNSEFPEELKDTYPNMVAEMMKEAAAKYYYKIPLPAEPAVGDHWIH